MNSEFQTESDEMRDTEGGPGLVKGFTEARSKSSPSESQA